MLHVYMYMYMYMYVFTQDACNKPIVRGCVRVDPSVSVYPRDRVSIGCAHSFSIPGKPSV